MKNVKWLLFSGFFTLTILISLLISFTTVSAQSPLDPSPPDETIKLIFIHHSVGEGWLADDQGGLGQALQENNYFVSDTYYGWGPDGIGDLTDTMDWPTWFTGPESGTYLEALYNESDANAAGYEYYTRTIPDPGGENQVIMFKSCFPNSEIGGSPDDPPNPDEWMTVGAVKYTYNQLLEYFQTRPDKLFIVITSPPMQEISQPENMRAVADWLVNDWLEENDYPLNNVAVFDFYNVLTAPDNHHWYNNGAIEHITNGGSDTLYYDSDGDDHPSAAGGRKATQEFVPLLNIYVNRWLADEPMPVVIEEPGEEPLEEPQGEQEPTEAPVISPLSPADAMIDDFENGVIPETDYWIPYWDEVVDTTIDCDPTSTNPYQGSYALQIDFNVLPQSWASCEFVFYEPVNWSGEGLQFYLQSSNAGLHYGLLFYYQQGEDWGTSIVSFDTPEESVGGWALVTIPWEEFDIQDSLVYPEAAIGMAFVFSGDDSANNTGTIWIDNLSLITGGEEPLVEPTSAPEVDEGEIEEDTPAVEMNEEDGGGASGICGSLPMIIGLVGIGMVGLRKKSRN